MRPREAAVIALPNGFTLANLFFGIFGIVGGATAVFTSWAAGKMDSSRGPKPVLVWSIVVLLIVCTVVVGMDREQIWGWALDPASSTPDIIFFVCGALIGADLIVPSAST